MSWRKIIGDILAVWEDVANDTALEFYRLAEEHALQLLYDRVNIEEGADEAEMLEAKRKEWAEVVASRDQAKAWRHISNALRRYLRLMNVQTYSKRRNDADNERRAIEAKARKRSYYS